MDNALPLFLTALCSVPIVIYAVLYLFSPHPRPPLPSELCYKTSQSSPPQNLPSLFDDNLSKGAEDDNVQLSIIVPAFNEVERLPGMMKDTMSYLTSSTTSSDLSPSIVANFKSSYEILIIDDGSTDSTYDLCLSFSQTFNIPKGRLRVVKLEINRGKGGAVTHGMLHARGKYLLFVDADGATAFQDVESLLEAILKEEEDTDVKNEGRIVAIGSRAHLVNTEAVVKRSLLRNALMRSFHMYLRLLGLSSIRDTQCGFKLFTRPSARLLFPYMHTERWIFDCELLILASLKNVKVLEVGVQWHEVSGSKVDVILDSIRMARDLAVVRANYLFGRWSKEKKAWQV